MAPEIAQILSAQAVLLVESPGPTDATAFRGLALVGPTSPDVIPTLAGLPDAPGLDRDSVRTLKTTSTALAVTVHPLRATGGGPGGAIVLTTDVSRTVGFMRRSLSWRRGGDGAGGRPAVHGGAAVTPVAAAR